YDVGAYRRCYVRNGDRGIAVLPAWLSRQGRRMSCLPAVSCLAQYGLLLAICPRGYLYGLLYPPAGGECDALCAQPPYGLVDHGWRCVRARLCDQRIHIFIDSCLWQLLWRFICLGTRPQMAFACQ